MKFIYYLSAFLMLALANKTGATSLSTEEYDAEHELHKSEYNPRFGVSLGYGWNIHNTDFKELPGFPMCCNNFESGQGNGINFGGFFQMKLTDTWHIGSSLIFSNLNAFLKSTSAEPIYFNGALDNAIIDKVLDCAINTISLSPYIAYNLKDISENFFVSLGFDAGIISKANFTQYERLIHPNYGTFENGYRTRNIVTSDITNKNFLFAGNIGIKYEFSLNSHKNIRLAPELKYHYWTSPVSKLKWNTNQLTFGVNVSYNAPPVPPILEDPLLPPLPELPYPQSEDTFLVEVSHKLSEIEGDIAVHNDILIEDFTYTNLKPLLNYIFFDENSATIPARYKQIDKSELLLNEYRSFAGFNSLETYYYVLDIIGLRMTKTPSSKIELVGTNADTDKEKNNITLSQARADAVKQYLVDKWDIASNRITTTARNLPKEPTRPTESGASSASGNEENRRVEIYSSDANITDAILSFDTICVVKTPNITFTPNIKSSFGIDKSILTISVAWQNGMENTNNLPNILEKIEIEDDATAFEYELKDSLFSNNKQSTIFYQLESTDKLGHTVISSKNSINIDRITVASKRNENNSSDTDFEYYSLILFDFASRNLAAKHNKVIDYIKTRIKNDSKIAVTGYTDIIGLPEVNKKIATERAVSTAKRLGVVDCEINGIGADELLYDNRFPEGRFYCRTVTIAIETPVVSD